MAQITQIDVVKLQQLLTDACNNLIEVKSCATIIPLDEALKAMNAIQASETVVECNLSDIRYCSGIMYQMSSTCDQDRLQDTIALYQLPWMSTCALYALNYTITPHYGFSTVLDVTYRLDTLWFLKTMIVLENTLERLGTSNCATPCLWFVLGCNVLDTLFSCEI